MNSLSDADPKFRAVRVDACKYDGSVHRSWSCRLIDETAELWILDGVFEKEIRHQQLGIILQGTSSLEYYWKNRWHNVFLFYEPDGAFRNYYCNVNAPPELVGDVLRYIDLDIDVLVQPDLSYQVLDLDEFAQNSQKHRYPATLVEQARRSLDYIVEMIERRQFPFSPNGG